MKTKQEIIAHIKQALDYPIDMDEHQLNECVEMAKEYDHQFLFENSVAYAKIVLGSIRSMFPNPEAKRLIDEGRSELQGLRHDYLKKFKEKAKQTGLAYFESRCNTNYYNNAKELMELLSREEPRYEIMSAIFEGLLDSMIEAEVLRRLGLSYYRSPIEDLTYKIRCSGVKQ